MRYIYKFRLALHYIFYLSFIIISKLSYSIMKLLILLITILQLHSFKNVTQELTEKIKHILLWKNLGLRLNTRVVCRVGYGN